MGLERWDRERGKWVLYTSQEEHSEDCRRHPFEKIPGRVFLDTNVVNLLVKYRRQIFEQAPIPTDLDTTKAYDLEALFHIFQVGRHADWDLLASRKTLDELDRTPDEDVRSRLRDYAVGLAELLGEESEHASRLGQRLVEAPFMAALPDENDRELIGNAVGYECDAFCTCDRRTIVSKRDTLARILPIRIMTPVEWWASIKPWGRLWL